MIHILSRFAGLLLLLVLFNSISLAQTDLPLPPKREVRAVWIATVAGLDWPKTQNPAEQQRSLLDMVVKLKAANFNTIFFQVRGRGDAMYKSRSEPWAQQLTGTLGEDPGWDPLAFIVKEAHTRGMEVHAWFNTFLIKSGKLKPPESSPRHLILQHPEWFHLVEGEWWLDPGIPEARQYIINICMEIIRNYDIDGFHFDFIRYPGKPFPDDAAYRQYGKKMLREDWRRENINTFVHAFYDSATAAKPMLKVGSAPIGIYANVTKASGLQAYYDLFQDSRGWLRERKHDYVAPQVYWSLGDRPGNPDFAALAKDWPANSFGRHVYVGVGAYKPDVLKELPQLIDSSRSAGAAGNAFFRYENVSNVLAMGGRYFYPANIPPMTWKDHILPNPPKNLTVENIIDGIFRLQWQPPDPASDGDGAKYFNVYRSSRKPVDVNDPRNLLMITPDAWTSYLDTIVHPSAPKYYYAVAALDKGNNESFPTIEKGVVIPEIVEISKRFFLDFKLGGNYPNPASDIVFISYELKESSPVLLKIVDGANREVADIVDAVQSPGRYIAAANISKLKSGTYSYLLVAGSFSEKKLFKIEN
jgi:uncharacterized lipoprotein YddW (UPF0748 family)